MNSEELQQRGTADGCDASAGSAPSKEEGHARPFSDAVVRQLNALTSAFYAQEAASFSATRQSPWKGWGQALSLINETDPALLTRPVHLLDLGCGNLRFERALAERTSAPLTVTAVDNCPPLVAKAQATELPARTSVDFRQLDVIETLLDETLPDRLPNGTCHLAVAFGVMHHVPRFDLRAQLLSQLVRALRPGGFAVVSFWQFMDDPRLAAKAERATAEGRTAQGLPLFGDGDYLLPWQHAADVYRFCHHCDEEEITQLIAEAQTAAALREVARFSADGKSGTLNRYCVLQRR